MTEQQASEHYRRVATLAVLEAEQRLGDGPESLRDLMVRCTRVALVEAYRRGKRDAFLAVKSGREDELMRELTA